MSAKPNHARVAQRLLRPRGGLDRDPLGGALRPRRGRAGPLILEEYEATSLVPPGARASLDDYGSIVLGL